MKVLSPLNLFLNVTLRQRFPGKCEDQFGFVATGNHGEFLRGRNSKLAGMAMSRASRATSRISRAERAKTTSSSPLAGNYDLCSLCEPSRASQGLPVLG